MPVDPAVHPDVLKVRLDALEKLLDVRFESRDLAVLTALKALDKRLDGMNEIRQSLKDAQATFITSAEARGEFKSIEKDLSMLKVGQSGEGVRREQKTTDRGNNQWSISQALTVLIAIIGWVVVLILAFKK
jgi:hypothetical protein